MTRDEYDRIVATVARASNRSIHDAADALVAQGIRPPQVPQAESYVEACRVYGALQDLRPLRDICDDYGWSDPGAIQHVAIAATQRRKFVVLQQEEDGQPQVAVYIYATDSDAGDWWMISTPEVLAS